LEYGNLVNTQCSYNQVSTKYSKSWIADMVLLQFCIINWVNWF